MTTVDPQQILLTLLSNNWNTSNVDGTRPDFLKITDKKRWNYRKNKDVIMTHVHQPEKQPAGIGTIMRHDIDKIDLDVRAIGETRETHWLKMLDETRRILDANIISPALPYDLLNSDFPENNLSNQTHHIFRMLIPVELTNFVQLRSAIPTGG